MATPKTKKTLVLLDVHAILHRAYHALPDFQSGTGEPTGALYGLCTLLIKLVKDLKPDYIVACYDLPEPTMRHEVYEGYKAGRKKTDDALVQQLERSKDVFKAFRIPMYSSAGFEADDMLGTIVEQVKNDKTINVVIASGDMDTLQLVSGDTVRVYTLKKGIKDTIIYNEDAVLERFGFGPELLPDFKGLRGDPSDNIIGISGIGEKTAQELIVRFGSIEDIYKKLAQNEDVFIKAGIKKRVIELLKAGEEEALFSKMLATIRRDAPIHFMIPDKIWREDVQMKEVQDLFMEFEFRTLGAKVAEALSLEMPTDTLPSDVSENDVREAGLLLWVIDSNKTNPTLDDILSYTRTRTLDDARKVLRKMITDQKLDFVVDSIELPLTPIANQMKERGIKIDIDRLTVLSKKYHTELDSIQKKIWGIAGVEFNIASPKQLGEILFVKLGLKPKNQKKTGTGAYSTKESELEKLKDEHEIAGLVLEYRELAKLLGTYIDTMPTQVDDGHRLHADFLQAGTTTGRMASQNPNLQNIPNKSDLGREIRKSFIAEPGFKLVSFDYSQIELRIAAFLSGDSKLIEIFKTGHDVHTAVASEVFGVDPAEVTKEMRAKAKVINFGVMYGMGVMALKQNLGTSKEDAQIFYDDYFKKFSGLAEYLEKVKHETAQKGYTETFFGRRRYFPDIRSKLPFMKAQAERMAINAPIQGTEADIIKLAMIEVHKFIQTKNLSNDVRLLLQVHDELVYEVAEHLVDSVAPEIKYIMQNVIDPKQTSSVVCIANSSAGDNWGEMEKI
ncbi:MAG: polymerase [Patescibacteria group bacterium]|nr:polymerase [Patescibacteria group bacterium]